MKRIYKSRLQLPAENGPTSDKTIHDAAASWVARRDAGLSPVESAEFAAWLATDPRHRAAFAEYGSAWTVLDRAVRGGAAEDVLDQLRGLDRRQRRQRVLSAAMAMVVLLASVSLWKLSGERGDGGDEWIPATARVLLPARQTLPDGSIVELKDGAEIAPSFSAELRRVALHRGEAHFQVMKDSARPFVVVANGVEVRAVGTAFAVQLRNNSVEVIVTEGRIAVEKGENRGERESRHENQRLAVGENGPESGYQTPVTEPFRLSVAQSRNSFFVGTGEHALIELATAAAEVRAVAPDELSERLAWRTPRLEFTGTPLADVVMLLNRHAAARDDVRLTIEDAIIAQVRVSGLFRADNTAALLDLLESGFGISAEHRGESEIILRRVKTN